MTGATYSCTSCGHEPADDDDTGGALLHCEVCGSWVSAPRAAVARDLDLRLLSIPA